MPAKSAKQERFMQAVAHNPKFAAEAGVPQSVGKEFTKKRFARGGSTEYVDSQVEAAVNPKPKAAPKPEPAASGPAYVNPRPGRPDLNAEQRDKLRKKQDEATFAKGGSIDGCAQRGKTRAGRR